jgi:hypothetical protein
VLSFYSTAWMADTCQFVSIYRVVSLAHQKWIGSNRVQAERLFWVWVGYLSKYFCRERNLVQCVFWASERWVDACAGWDWDWYIKLYLWTRCFGVGFTGETKDEMMRMGMVGLDTMSVNLRNESAL